MDAEYHSANLSDKRSLHNVKSALRDFRSALDELYQEDCPKILIFGSQARKEASETSDIDVLLLYPDAVNPGTEIRRISPILADLNLRFQVLISILPAAEEKYQKSQSLFWKNIKREGINIESI